MFVILVNYKKPIEVVEKYLESHRAYLDECYKKNYLIASGPQNPRTGGIILSHAADRQKLDEIICQDPFFINQIADFKVIEFTPVKYHKKFIDFIQ